MKSTFLFLLILSFLLINFHDCFSQWTVISNQGNEAVWFPSQNTGYSTANGISKKTTNGGYNWSSLSGGNLTGIFFIDNMTGWVCGYPGYIAKTTNGGSFVQENTGVSDRLNSVFFIDYNTGWVVGGDFGTERIFKTTDGGSNWAAQTSNTANKLFSVYFIDANTGWSVGGPSSPKIICTTNGGTNWVTQFTSVNTPLYWVMFADANTGWAVAGYIGGETIIKTTNAGMNWFSQSSGDSRYLRACFVLNSNKAFAVGQSGKIIGTTNGGNNWVVINTGSSIELWTIDFPNDSIGYAIGDNVVLKTTNGGITFVNNNISEIPDEFRLEQNFPNPFNPSTKIKFSLPLLRGVDAESGRGMFANLTIFDILGNKIADLVNQKLNPGSYEIEWNASRYPSGVYFYRLKVENASVPVTITKKMALIK